MSGIELNVTDENKEKLKCFSCNGYLLYAPIHVLPNGNNVCGHCIIDNNDPNIYRNTVLEALLQDAVFPCKYHSNGCLERLQFLSNYDHEKNCSFINITPEPSTSKVPDDKNQNMDIEENVDQEKPQNAIKSSASTCDQEIPSHSNTENPHLVYPKVSDSVSGVTTGTSTSVCSDGHIRTNRQNGRSRTSARLRSIGNSHNFDRNSNHAASSIGSNQNSNHWQQPYNRYNHQRPYDVGWGFNNLFNRRGNFRPEHVFYKRRNNVIIIKGGTFYVNW